MAEEVKVVRPLNDPITDAINYHQIIRDHSAPRNERKPEVICNAQAVKPRRGITPKEEVK